MRTNTQELPYVAWVSMATGGCQVFLFFPRLVFFKIGLYNEHLDSLPIIALMTDSLALVR